MRMVGGRREDEVRGVLWDEATVVFGDRCVCAGTRGFRGRPREERGGCAGVYKKRREGAAEPLSQGKSGGRYRGLKEAHVSQRASAAT